MQTQEQALPISVGDVNEKEMRRRKTFNRNKWFFSVSGIGRDMSYQLISAFLLTYIQFGIPLTLTQFTIISLAIGVGGRIWDAINDPIMGSIIESSHMKFGKFKPWILIGAVTCGAVIIAMFNVQNLSGTAFVIYIIIMYLLWESTFTMNDIGYWAMLPSLSSVKSERNNITVLTVLFAGIGAIAAQGVIPFVATGNVRESYRWISIVIVIVFVASQIMTTLLVKETPHAEDFKQEKVGLKKMWKAIKNNDQILWMTLSQLFYNVGSALLVALALNLLYTEVGYSGANYIYIVGAYGVTSVLVNIFYPKLADKFGRKKLQLYSIILACVGYVCIACMGWGGNFSMWLLAIICVFISAGQSIFYMASIVNMTNCVEYNEYKQGERNEAVISTLRPFMAKFGSACQYGITTLVLIVSGIFIMSQSISTIETQKSMFGRLSDYDTQITYMETIQGYDSLTEEQLADAIEDNTFMSTDCQLGDDPDYIDALQDVLILRNTYNANGDKIGIVIMGRLGELTTAQLNETAPVGQTYAFEMVVGDYTVTSTVSETDSTPITISSGYVGDELALNAQVRSAADLHFKDVAQADLGARIWLRAAVTVVPIVLLILALVVQRKKFFIDEEYYDMMMVEIEKREAEKLQELKEEGIIGEEELAEKPEVEILENIPNETVEEPKPDEPKDQE